MKFSYEILYIIPLQFLIMLAYFPIARRLKLYDIPNERSSHSNIAFRGGGVIVPLSIILYLIFFGNSGNDMYLISGILLAAAISFYDDYKGANIFLRLICHFVAVGLIMKQISEVLPKEPLETILIAIVCVAAVNAYNFMDGINAITGLYTLSIYETIIIYQTYISDGILLFNPSLLIILIIALIIFGFYNFRTKAVVFAGDVGSVSLGLLAVFYILKMIFYNEDIIYLSMVAVYGVESGLTIFYRLFKGQNIFQAHRMHLFQDLVNKVGFSHLKTSLLYTLVQVIINAGMLVAIHYHFPGYYYFAYIIILLVTSYIILKYQIKKNYSIEAHEED
jgi:UDP-GlcNAc:undecaprenyl-phosphate GlcNAc-1-phosphate transferase